MNNIKEQFVKQLNEEIKLKYSQYLRLTIFQWIVMLLGPVYNHLVQRTAATRLIIAAKQVSVFS
jgi:Na+-driven multidrug efflux pump